ncbi:MAG TPA: hypothetical protein DC054_21165 [Blastocatellia bacterium]|nr:hypothetical protein [Blastocatellia bacterium]
MRWFILLTLALSAAALLACNSNETLLSQAPAKQSSPASTPGDAARRIGVEELHKLWLTNDVFIIDTRPEPTYKQEHIKGSISMFTGTVLDHLADLPKDKLIVAYCT